MFLLFSFFQKWANRKESEQRELHFRNLNEMLQPLCRQQTPASANPSCGCQQEKLTSNHLSPLEGQGDVQCPSLREPVGAFQPCLVASEADRGVADMSICLSAPSGAVLTNALTVPAHHMCFITQNSSPTIILFSPPSGTAVLGRDRL